MANSDAIIANGTGQTVREDIQANLQALKSNNSTNTIPSGNSLTSYMSWANTGDNQYMVHNGTSFHPILDISAGTSAGTHIAGAGTTAIPGYRFMNNAGSSATQSGMGLPDDGRLGFFMDGSEKISLLSDGKVGIGTTAPSNTFTVLGNQTIYTTNIDAVLNVTATNSQSTNQAYIDLVADTTYTDFGLRVRRNTVFTNNIATFNSEIVSRGAGQLQLICQDAGAKIKFATSNTTRWSIGADGGLRWEGHTGTTAGSVGNGEILCRGIRSRQGTQPGVNVANPYNFYWTGNTMQCWVDASNVGNVGLSSDYRIKENIALQTESGIDKIKQLKPVTYKFTDYEVFKADGVTREGFIAHEVQEVIPSGVNGVKDGDEIQSLNIDAITSVLTKALQEAVAKIETLEAKVAALEAG